MTGERQSERRKYLPLLMLAVIASGGLLLRLRFLIGDGGPLASPTDYDDGVYFSASALLVRGVLPYRDFVFVHPPGIAWFYAVVAWLDDPAIGFAAARVLASVAGALSTFLAGAIVLRSGSPFGAAVAAVLYATYPHAVIAERSTYLEPILNLFCLASAFVWLRPDGPRPHRSFGAGLLAGAACAVKLLGGIWVVAAVASAPRGRFLSTAGRFIAGGVAAGTILLVPLFAAAPSSFLSQVLVFQLSRPSDGVAGAALRLPLILGSGHLAATLLSIVALLAAMVTAIRYGLASVQREERLFSVATILTIAAFLASSSYWAEYNSYLAASQCVLAGLGAAALLRATTRPPIVAAVVAAVIGAMLYLPLRETLGRARERSGDLAALRRSAASIELGRNELFSFDPSWGLVAGQLPSHRDGAPTIVDSYGAMLLHAIESGGRFTSTEAAFRGASGQPAVRQRLEHSRFAIVGWRGNWQLPDEDRAWVQANFLCTDPSGGDLCVRRRLVAPLDAIAIADDATLLFGEGWYAEEGSRTASWRWMGKRGAVTLQPLSGAARLQLELYVPPETQAARPVVTIALGERELDRFQAAPGEILRNYQVPASADARTLSIAIDQTFVPARTGGQDRRELGLSLKRIIWLSGAEWERLFR